MHIGFGQNTVSSLYGHQKGDYMKTIGFSHKKHKANESQEKMTVTSGKDVCRKIGHSDEVDGENQENTYIHDSFALDAGYANYIRETVPKTVWSNDYLRELWDENAKYLKSIRESKNGYGFDDIGMGAAYALSLIHIFFVCVIWSFDEMGLREQVILSDTGNRETEQIINIGKVIIFWNRDGRMFYVKDYRLCFFISKNIRDIRRKRNRQFSVVSVEQQFCSVPVKSCRVHP